MDEHRKTAALGWIRQPRPVELVGGSATVRGADLSDADALAAMHLRCSLDTVYRRYFNAVPRLSRTWQQTLLVTDVALVAVAQTASEPVPHVVALGNLCSLPSRAMDGQLEGAMEVALLVEDGYQGRGLGTAMLRQLAAAAWLLGHRTLRADTLATSAPMHRLLARLGPHTVDAAAPGGLTTFGIRLGHGALSGLGDPWVAVTRAG